MAGRTVILLSDHGHILDCNAKGKQYEGGERWRFASCQFSVVSGQSKTDNRQMTTDKPPEPGELLICGERVVIPESKCLISPWTEKIRYGVKKNGYHGGVSPQEMVIPIAVLNSTNAFPTGWSEAPVDTPLWWDIAASPAAAEPETVRNLKPVEPKPVPAGMLFRVDEEESGQWSVVSGQSLVVSDQLAESGQRSGSSSQFDAEKSNAVWILALLQSSVYDEQKRLGGRAVRPEFEPVLIQLLQVIDGRGGKITVLALARAMNMPPSRLPGLLAVAQRVLNVDGYEVLSRDHASDTVQLDRELLLKQFDLVE
jgi:hypothetical protein